MYQAHVFHSMNESDIQLSTSSENNFNGEKTVD